jgi:hypothetical protein
MEKLPLLYQISAWNVLSNILKSEKQTMSKKRRTYPSNCRCRYLYQGYYQTPFCCLWCKNLRIQFVIALRRRLLNRLLSLKRRKLLTIPDYKYFTCIVESFLYIRGVKYIRHYVRRFFDPLCYPDIWLFHFSDRFYEHFKYQLGVFSYYDNIIKYY